MNPVSTPADRDLVLVGGGHSHALALRMLAMNREPGLRLTLVSPDSLAAYSGMLPGLVAGHYTLEETHVDLRRLCQASGARFVCARVTDLDPAARRLTLDDGTTLDYDWLSLDVGATPDLDAVPGAAAHAVPVKPVSDFHYRWRSLLADLDHRTDELAISVVGGGAGGTEMILAVARALIDHGLAARLTLVTAGELLPGYPDAVRRRMARRLADYGVRLCTESPVRRVEAGRLILDHDAVAHDFLLWCTGVKAAPWLAASGLPCDERGFVRVDERLRSPADKRIFAAGDCAAFPGDPPKAGVYAVRQAPTLAHNLAAAAGGRALRAYRPQKRFLSLLSAGDRDAVGSRGPLLTVAGPWVWRWKDRIDRRFMARFDEPLPPMPAPAAEAGPHCAGCGAKIGAGALGEALERLQPAVREGIEAGVDQADDAAVIRWPAGQRLVQTLDYFPAFLDEPFVFGRVAALHALSDLYAMNATPHSALATVCLPRHHPRLQGRDLQRLMAGAVTELNRAGCTLVGGHTIEGPELAAGFTVNGAAAPEALWHKGGARPGQCLILTGALGTGIQLASLMHGRARGPWLDATLEAMLAGNGAAREALAGLGDLDGTRPGACTDVTGFGLLGHLLEICQQSDVDARLNLETVPLLPGTLTLVEAGVTSTLKPANDQVLARCEHHGVATDDPRLAALTDPQTSGGLLFSIDRERAPAALAALRRHRVPGTQVGELTVKNHKAFPTLTLHDGGPC
ncbi:MAG: selenide, water dikinase SelD [Alcanivorax sp.]|nr:selenide, water dikinase SelD [Alcanivorax sp.]MAY10431.1 selenide, water dikinase SelD [Alcanivorax sp.]MBI53511.1 selenide, water dikinase SelD [Alcanivorax sp.]MBM1142979.1 selenide, water dikinase SelD [Alcanivorax sp. ZXX171]HCE38556.1 selenide, water dikinase SelD [Alcanivorax sp.]|tara:strand:- start:14427 stop:16649 length:2223 start_codon:yes stop_codon:yes gene_type:complete